MEDFIPICFAAVVISNKMVGSFARIIDFLMDLEAILKTLEVQVPTVEGPGPYRWGSTPMGFGFGCFFLQTMVLVPRPWGSVWGIFFGYMEPMISQLFIIIVIIIPLGLPRDLLKTCFLICFSCFSHLPRDL